MGKNGKLLLALSDLKAAISEVEIIEAGRQKNQVYLSGCVWKCVLQRAHSADSNADIFDYVSFRSLVPYMMSISIQ